MGNGYLPSSRFEGFHSLTNGSTWRGLVKVKGKSIYTGTCKTVEEAAYRLERLRKAAGRDTKSDLTSKDMQKLQAQDNWQDVLADKPPTASVRGTSKYLGVSIYRGKWRAQLQFKQEYYYLCLYADEVDAASAVV